MSENCENCGAQLNKSGNCDYCMTIYNSKNSSGWKGDIDVSEIAIICEAHNGRPQRNVTLKIGDRGYIDGSSAEICTITGLWKYKHLAKYRYLGEYGARFSIDCCVELFPVIHFYPSQWIPLNEATRVQKVKSFFKRIFG